ncbi:chromosome partitioning protein [Caulobacter ginsengisoli]|uniref:Chromosome partitioning protein n=1 Tax=Caulobacter ginsengisoli TaxID=400775 RepID=A0ABU0IWD2_9CAUL|nr:division plane positioning ATPase MipZ [Caulobacter ginsengisoli]MDQ0465463.1 chromosome partitioning protein [Caulobacter ginsengisoli]
MTNDPISMLAHRRQAASRGPAAGRVVVFANEKGGAGKSTLAALVATAMLYRGARVAVIDLDLRQQTMSRFYANRRRWLPAAGVTAPVPLEYKLAEDTVTLAEASPDEIVARFGEAVRMAMADTDLVVVDTPGGDSPVGRAAHLQADLVVSPMNDSFVDFDMLATVDPLTLRLLRPSLYSRVVLDARKIRNEHGRRLDWVVVRNRMGASDARNRRRLLEVLQQLGPQVGFRLGPSLGERVAYREMFPFGLTIADLSPGVRPVPMASPRLVAREELRELLEALRLIAPANPALAAPVERGATLQAQPASA